MIRDSSVIDVHLSDGTESVFLTLDGQTGIPMNQVGPVSDDAIARAIEIDTAGEEILL